MFEQLLSEKLNILINIIYKYVKFFIFVILCFRILYLINDKNIHIDYINDNMIHDNNYCFSSKIENISNINNIYFKILNIEYYYSNEYKLMEIKYFIKLTDKDNNSIKPSDLSLIYNLNLICNTYIFEVNDNIYSLANNYDNKLFFCHEYINFYESAKFGIKIYKINYSDEEIEYFDCFFFSNKLIKSNLKSKFINNNKFNINYIYNNYYKLLFEIDKSKKFGSFFTKTFTLKSSFLKPPLFCLKKDLAQKEGKWYFDNIYDNYFCFCRGESCIDIKIFNNYNFQYCKYLFFLTIIDRYRNLYRKNHFLLSDFFDENIESSDALPIFQEMIIQKLNAHYLTMSLTIYQQFCLNHEECSNNLKIIYGVRRINGDVLEKYFELFLRLKAVITAEPYDSIDNLFYNIEYITYIFLGHGVQYIKSFLYKNYLSHKRFNKMLLPPNEKIINTAVERGWDYNDIIKIGLPKWDNYMIYTPNFLNYENIKNIERSIFLMFTWRKVKKGKSISDLYYSNLYKILNNQNINEQLYNNNIKLFFCYHHRLKIGKQIKTNRNIKLINQNDISTLLKNCTLIITDFSAIIFDAIIQKKPLIIYIPDALDNNLKELYVSDYYETIMKIKNGEIYLYEVFYDLKKVINKIIYYIKNDFVLEKEKLQFYNQFKFKNRGNTKKFIRYIRRLK